MNRPVKARKPKQGGNPPRFTDARQRGTKCVVIYAAPSAKFTMTIADPKFAVAALREAAR